jgi:hypothetical protein
MGVVVEGQGSGFPAPIETWQKQVTLPRDPANKAGILKEVSSYNGEVLDRMERMGFSHKDRMGVFTAIDEIPPDILKYGEGDGFTINATLKPEQAVLKFTWQEREKVDIQGLVHRRQDEIDRVAQGGKDAYKQHLQERVEDQSEQGLGGAGLGLIIVNGMNDSFTSTQDPKTKVVTVTVVKNRTGE